MNVTRAASCVVLFAAAMMVWSAAPVFAAEPANTERDKADNAALEELKALLQLEPKPKTQEEAMTKLKELLPKIEAFADKHTKDKGGAIALLISAQVSMQMGDPKKTGELLDKFLKMYPQHEATADAKGMLAMSKFQAGDYAGAKTLLEAHLKDYPTYRGKPQVEALLAKINQIGAAAKDFTTKDLAGKAVKLADYKGKVLMIDFFASWCGPCRTEMPNVKKAYETYHKLGFEIVGISLDRTVTDLKDYIDKEKLPWTVTFEEPGYFENPVAKLYGIEAIPATYLLDKEGKVVALDLRGEQLQAALAKLFPANITEEKK